MSRLLDTIVQATRLRLEERKARCPQSELEQRVKDAPEVRPLSEALASRDFSVIAEHKVRSPSGGDMLPSNLERCLDVYASTPWISAISVLTNEDHFKGSLDDLVRARSRCGARPVLRKDFIVDEYQVYEARAFGADAMLLMTAVHARSPELFKRLFQLATELGLDCLIEIGMGDGDPAELSKMVPPAAKVWGVNARAFVGSLDGTARESRESVQSGGADLLTSLGRHDDMFHLVPAGALAVAESGIRNAEDLIQTAAKGYRAALIGTAFLKGPRSVEDVLGDLGSAFEDSGRLRTHT